MSSVESRLKAYREERQKVVKTGEQVPVPSGRGRQSWSWPWSWVRGQQTTGTQPSIVVSERSSAEGNVCTASADGQSRSPSKVKRRTAVGEEESVQRQSKKTLPMKDTQDLSSDQVSLREKLTPENKTLFTLKVLLWVVLWGLFAELEFGAVYFVLSSLLILVYLGTSSGSKKKSGPSAYSVFNPNCERLQGTFTGEDFDRQLRQGGGMI